MKFLKNLINRIWEKLLIVVGVLFVLIPTSPINMPLTYTDSGVFHYFGWRILNGEVPYRDVWDHKPPIIFYLNALGLSITNHPRWGVWLLEFISLFLAAIIGFYLLKKALGFYPAISSLLLGLITLTFILHGGNFPEEYALPLQFFALWLFYDSEKSSFSFWHWFLIGLIGAIAFFTKQTTIGIWIAIIIYLTVIRLNQKQISQWIKEILTFAGGGVVVLSVIIIFFGIQGALVDFWNAAFIYNFIYSSEIANFAQRLRPLIAGLMPLTKAGLFQFGLIGYGIGIVLILFRKDIIKKWMPLLSVGLIALPIELILVSVSGQIYSQYYICLLPVLILFSSLTFWVIFSQLFSWNLPKYTSLVFQLFLVVIFLWSSVHFYRNQTISYSHMNEYNVINYVESHSVSSDYVLLWGAESYINFFANRKSPTRFVYQFPLYRQGYVDEQMILEFLDDVIKNNPRLIIDSKRPTTPIFDFPIQTDQITERSNYLRKHYRRVDTLVNNLGVWDVYEYTDDEIEP